MHCRFLVCLLLAAPLGAAVPAFAADPPKPARGAPSAAPKPKERADELFEQSTAALDAGRIANAERLLQEAWSLKQTHDIAGNLGLVELKLGKLAEGAQHLAWALQHFPPSESDAGRRVLEQELAGARGKIGALRIHVNVAAADVAVNGKTLSDGALAEEVFVAPGAVTVVGSHEGYVAVSQSLTVAGGAETRQVTLTLVPLGDRVQTRSVVPGAVIGGGAAAGAAIVTGVVLLGLAAAKGSTVSSLQAQIQHEGGCASVTAGGDCASLRSAGSSRQTLGTAGLWTLVAGAGVGTATLVYALVGGAKAPPPKSGWRVLPAATSGGGGLFVQGTF